MGIATQLIQPPAVSLAQKEAQDKWLKAQHNKRRERAEEAIWDKLWEIEKLSEEEYSIKTQGGTYQVNLKELSCTCPDFKERASKYNLLCKHILGAISEHLDNLSDLIDLIAERSLEELRNQYQYYDNLTAMSIIFLS